MTLQYSIETAIGFASASVSRQAAEKRASDLAGTSIEEFRSLPPSMDRTQEGRELTAKAYKTENGTWQWTELRSEIEPRSKLDETEGDTGTSLGTRQDIEMTDELPWATSL